MKLKYFFVIATTIILTRFIFLGSFPPWINIDEVAIGYNAFSILETGRDEWGNFLPATFKSVGDYKTPFLIYLTAPFMKVFGLNEYTLRLPSAIFSTAAIVLLFILGRKYLFSSGKKPLAILLAFLAALSPWYIFYSRFGYEVVLAVPFIILNVYFLYRFKEKPDLFSEWGIFLSAFLAAITYNTAKLFIPLLDTAVLLYLFPKVISTIKKEFSIRRLLFLTAIFIQAVLIFWYLKNHVFGPGANRAAMVFITRDYEFFRILEPDAVRGILGKLGGILVLVGFWFKRYLEYFSPNFYISTGLDIVMAGQPGMGVVYPIEFFLFVAGLIALFKNKLVKIFFIDPSFTRFVIVAWILLGFLPASLANNSQQSLRSLIVFPAVYIVICLGLVTTFEVVKKSIKKILIILLAVSYLTGITRFADIFLVHFPYQMSEYRGYAWKDTALYVLANADKYDTVYVDPRLGTQGPYIVSTPHLYFLFYDKFDPAVFQASPEVKAGRSSFKNFKFEYIDWNGYDHSKNNLYVASPWSFPMKEIKPSQIKHTVKFLNGQVGLLAISDHE